jgi:hypothetical protein
MIADDINAEPSRRETWDQLRTRAMVYVATRDWVSVTANDLFLDDLGDERLKGMVGELLLATPGHLGETSEEQARVASLLQICQLSSRFHIALRLEGQQSLPADWARGLECIITLIQPYAQEEDVNGAPIIPPVVSYYRSIFKALVDGSTETNAWQVYAARAEDRLFIAGQPDDFAADLCRVLLQWAGLANRRDLDELAPTLTQLIGWMNRPDKLAARLEQLHAQQRGQPKPPLGQSPAVLQPESTVPDTKPPLAVTGTATATATVTSSTPTPPPTPVPTESTPDVTPYDGKNAETGSSTDAPGDQPIEPPLPSGGYTSDDRERRLKAVRRRRAELDAEQEALLAVAPIPDGGDKEENDGDEHPRQFGSDLAYREAAMEYERRQSRYPMAKDEKQPGHDIDSFDKPLEDSDRRLARRIEVKGWGTRWEDDEIVALSDRQFSDALARKSEDISLADDFDYWLYVVERWEDGTLHVLPIKNPSARASKFEFRGGTWRALADKDSGCEVQKPVLDKQMRSSH